MPRKVVEIATDEASTFAGCKSRVQILLKEKYPHILHVHDLNHRLSLGVRKAMLSNHLYLQFDKSKHVSLDLEFKSDEKSPNGFENALKQSKKTLKNFLTSNGAAIT